MGPEPASRRRPSAAFSLSKILQLPTATQQVHTVSPRVGVLEPLARVDCLGQVTRKAFLMDLEHLLPPGIDLSKEGLCHSDMCGKNMPGKEREEPVQSP